MVLRRSYAWCLLDCLLLLVVPEQPSIDIEGGACDVIGIGEARKATRAATSSGLPKHQAEYS